jgi:hypothetical protein
VVVLLAIAGAAVYQRSFHPRAPLDDVRVLAAVTTVQDDGSRAADLVGYARVVPGRGSIEVVLVPGTMRVDVPGVTDDRLRDVYAYGGAGLLAKAFSGAVGVPVDAALVVDEPALIGALGRAGPVPLLLAQDVAVFRQDRYEAFSAGMLSLEPTQVADLIAAAGLAEPPGEDMTLQAALVTGTAGLLADGPAGQELFGAAETSGDRTVLRRLGELAATAGWPRVEVVAASGAATEEAGKLYFDLRAGSIVGRGAR